MRRSNHSHRAGKGFTLLETVIAIGVLAVLLTGFVAVFTPAAAGIRKSINSQEIDRLASTFERELTNIRVPATPPITGFEQAFNWVRDSNAFGSALLVYQYRGNVSSLRSDGTPTPVPSAEGVPGRDYVVVPMLRRRAVDNAILNADLAALEGGVYVVKCTQLVPASTANGGLELGTPGTISNPDSGPAANATGYTEAVLPFAAEFFIPPSRAASYLTGAGFEGGFNSLQSPIFTRNMAVRR